MLTEILERGGKRKVVVEGGDIIEGRKLVSNMLWDVVTTGTLKLPDGKTMEAEPKEWFEIVKFIYSQIDGPPRATIGITDNDGNDVLPSLASAFDSKISRLAERVGARVVSEQSDGGGEGGGTA
jgi:hypothetical protein